MKSHISIPEWLSMDKDTRRQFMAKFNIRASGPTEIFHDVNNRTIEKSDGVMDRDLAVSFSIEHMIEYLGEALPWYRKDFTSYLFKLVQDKFYGKEVTWDEGTVGTSGSTIVGSTPDPEGTEPRRKGRPRKEPPGVQGNA